MLPEEFFSFNRKPSDADSFQEHLEDRKGDKSIQDSSHKDLGHPPPPSQHSKQNKDIDPVSPKKNDWESSPEMHLSPEVNSSGSLKMPSESHSSSKLPRKTNVINHENERDTKTDVDPWSNTSGSMPMDRINQRTGLSVKKQMRIVNGIMTAWLCLTCLLLRPHCVAVVTLMSLVEQMASHIIPRCSLQSFPCATLIYCLWMGQAFFFFQVS